MESTVAVVRCAHYGLTEVRAAVARGLELLGGAERFARAGERVLLKPNMLVGDPPERCVTTHPAVFRALAEALQARGAALSYGDSPAIGRPAGVARKTGLAAVAAELAIPLADFENGRETAFPEGRQNRRFFIAEGVLASQALISLPKLKTHAFQRLTGSIKNQFGCIPGLRKSEFHVRLPDPEGFARMLVDLTRLVRPRLFVMDGVGAMEGNGPRGGRPKYLGLLLLSEDPVALDATVCRLLDIPSGRVPTLQAGAEAGLGVFRTEAIRLLGDPLERFRPQEGFAADRSPLHPPHGGPLQRLLGDQLVPRPRVTAEKCVRCGLCIQMCPTDPKSVTWPGGDATRPPIHIDRTCIRCYCCQEICPAHAIAVTRPPLRRLLERLPRCLRMGW